MEKRKATTLLGGWGRYPLARCCVRRPERVKELDVGRDLCIARGLGRSYGDAALNQGHEVVLMERLNRLLSFDGGTGLLRAEAGASLKEVMDVFVPRGWFPPVVPGTQWVTLGGCVATDVHGKNHHLDGCFSQHVRSLVLVTAEGEEVRCSREERPELFWATIGGMGLTGMILEVEVTLRSIPSAHMVVRHREARNLGEVMDLLRDDQSPYSVAWIDALATKSRLGRSILMSGRHAEADELASHGHKDPLAWKRRKQMNVPFSFPSFALSRGMVKAFNTAYYWLQRQKDQAFVVDFERYFFPLDALGNWNRIYGSRGFLQYQCVLPSESAREGLEELLTAFAQRGFPSFLAVLKRFGPQNEGFLSFPREGYTLALDLPLRGSSLFPFLDRMDEVVMAHGGRVYLAKDARMTRETFRAMYPNWEKWLTVKEQWDPEGCFSSDLSRRLGLGGSS